MAAKGETKSMSADQNNLVRRAAKAGKNARRQAAAAKRKQERANYRVGFEFKRDDCLSDVLERQAAQERAAKHLEAVKRGHKINDQINAWLDEVDQKGVLVLDVLGLFNQDGGMQAVYEMVGWLEQHKDRYELKDGATAITVARIVQIKSAEVA